MRKLTSSLDDKTKKLGVLSDSGSNSEEISGPVDNIGEVHAGTRRHTESSLRRKIDDLADARWLRDQLKEWDD